VATQRARPRRVRLTARDFELLSFMAEHRLVLDTQVQALLGTSNDAVRSRLGVLARAGYISRRPLFEAEPVCSQIRRAGLEAIASRLPVPKLNLAQYEHDVGLAWLWLAARDGSFGPLRAVISERELRSHDGREHGEPHGVRLGGFGPRGRERLHYPDLLLVTGGGRRVAIELELSSKGVRRRETILAGYAADARVDAVLYLVEKPALRRAIEVSAARLGISDRVHVRNLRWAERPLAEIRAADPAVARLQPGRARPLGALEASR
jgi:hypothetical protein